MTDQPQAATAEEKGKPGRKNVPPPKITSIEDLAVHLSTVVQTTENNRTVTNGGFKSFGGIKSMPPATLASLAGTSIMALCHQITGDGDNAADAAEKLDIVQKWLPQAQEEAEVSRKIQSYSVVADDLGLDAQGAKETNKQFVDRVQTAMAKKK